MHVPFKISRSQWAPRKTHAKLASECRALATFGEDNFVGELMARRRRHIERRLQLL
jgi:hypothetical protein